MSPASIIYNTSHTHTRVRGEVEHNFTTLYWLPLSLDLNPIEEVWRRMKDFIYRMKQKPTMILTMIAAVRGAWTIISDIEIRHLVDISD